MLADAYRWKQTIGDIAGAARLSGTSGAIAPPTAWASTNTSSSARTWARRRCTSPTAAWPSAEFAPDRTNAALGAGRAGRHRVRQRPGHEPLGRVARAGTGIPQPFSLRYVEIGNENGLGFSWGGGNQAAVPGALPPFYRRHQGQVPGHRHHRQQPHGPDAPPEVVDEHYYNDAAWFQAHATLYDGYDRKGPKIYVGEYAVTKDGGSGNLRAALGEAAFMTGLERNGDVVAMSSYAPLFANPAWKRWNPDAVVLRRAHAYGTPSYHVQAMFAANRADVVPAPEARRPDRSRCSPSRDAGRTPRNSSSRWSTLPARSSARWSACAAPVPLPRRGAR